MRQWKIKNYEGNKKRVVSAKGTAQWVAFGTNHRTTAHWVGPGDQNTLEGVEHNEEFEKIDAFHPPLRPSPYMTVTEATLIHCPRGQKL